MLSFLLIKGVIKIKKIVNYIIFGVLTTIINIISFYLFNSILNYQISTIIAWFISVIFAYITNKRYVFNSNVTETLSVLKECFNFFLSRIFSLLVDLMLMYLLITIFKINPLISKVAANVVIVILNYLLSNILVFNKK